MASTPPDPEDAIYEAAESETIPPKPNIWMLKRFLEARGVDIKLYTKDEWLKKYEQARAHLQEIKDDAEQVGRSQDKPGQSAGEKVPEWPKKIDPSSRKYDAEIDSAYQSEGSTDQNYRPECVIALVPGVEEVYYGGKAAIACSYSDDDNENYILEPISNRLKLQPGADGKVTLTFCWQDGGPSEVRKFNVRPLGEPGVKTDIRLGMKPLEERPESITKKDVDEGDEEEVQDIEPGALTKRRQPSIDLNNDTIIKVVGIAIGIGCAQSSNGDASKLGYDVRVATEAAIGGKSGRRKAP